MGFLYCYTDWLVSFPNRSMYLFYIQPASTCLSFQMGSLVWQMFEPAAGRLVYPRVCLFAYSHPACSISTSHVARWAGWAFVLMQSVRTHLSQLHWHLCIGEDQLMHLCFAKGSLYRICQPLDLHNLSSKPVGLF